MQKVLNITSLEAFNMLKQDAESALVDVRTSAEWSCVGVPDLTTLNKDVVLNTVLMQGGVVNESFLANLIKGVGKDKNRTLIFICKSGGRSNTAAQMAINTGYSNCYNVVGGFEATSSGEQKVNGWKASGLPFRFVAAGLQG